MTVKCKLNLAKVAQFSHKNMKQQNVEENVAPLSFGLSLEIDLLEKSSSLEWVYLANNNQMLPSRVQTI